MSSLRARLSFGLALSLVVLLLLQWAVASLVIERLIEGQLISRLAQDGESLLAGSDFDAQGRLTLNPQRINVVYQRPFSGHYYVIDSDGQQQISRSLWDSRLDIPAIKAGKQTVLRSAGPLEQKLLVVVHGYRKQNQDISIAVAEDMTALQAGLQRFQLIHGAVSLAILAILLLTQYLIVTGGMRPLKNIRADMARLGRGEIARIESQGPAEIAPVIVELNRLLGTMSKQTRRSREALGNLAHALKTRLTILNQAVANPEMAAHPQLRSSIEESAEAMRRIVERELKRARLIGDVLPGRRVNVVEEITLLVQTLRLMHAGKNPDISWSVAERVQFIGDQEDLLELLGNLLDNACKWCKSTVRLSVRADNDNAIVFTVEDDGPGCASETLDALTRRGFRADESQPGAGLGLAIARDIAESYEGSISFERSADMNGLLVEVWLPCATRQS